MLAAAATTILFSLSALFARRSSKIIGGTTANFYRILIATFFLGLWSHTFGIGLQGPALGWLFLGGMIGFGVGDVALFQALPRIGSRLSILIVQCLAAPIGAIAEYLWMGTRLSPSQIGCMILALTGVGIALAPERKPLQDPVPGDESTSSSSPRALSVGDEQYTMGIVAAIIASMGQALGAVISRKANSIALAEWGHTIHGIDAAYQRIWGGVLVTAIVFAVVRWKQRWVRGGETGSGGGSRPATPWGIIVANALAGPVLGVSCYQVALATSPTGIVLSIVALTPLVMIPFSHWMEGDRVRARELVGGILAVAGVSLLALLTPR